MGFDDTYTDLDFKQHIDAANRDWMRQFARREPDLGVEGFTGWLTRLLRLFSAPKR